MTTSLTSNLITCLLSNVTVIKRNLVQSRRLNAWEHSLFNYIFYSHVGSQDIEKK